MALFQTGINTSTGVRSVCACVGVYTNNAHDAHILTVLSYLLKAERMTLRCFREVFADEKRIEDETRCFSHAVILFDVIWLQLREQLLELHPMSMPLRLIEHMLCSAGPPRSTTTRPPCGTTSRRLVQFSVIKVTHLTLT